MFTKRPGQTAVIIGVVVGIGTVTYFRAAMAWPWYVLVGASVTVLVGSIVGIFEKRKS